MSTTELLRKIYYDPEHPAGFGSAEDVYRAAKKMGKKINRGEVEKFLQRQDAYTLHRPVRKNFPRRKTLARHVDHIWQADLIDMQQISKENRGFRYILTVIDILSRYAFAIPVKNKTGKSMIDAFKKIFNKSKRSPKKLFTDDGAEFFNRQFKSFLRENKIIHYSTASDVKASLVERFNRTLKSRMFRYFTARKTLYYLHLLPKLLLSYNRRTHSAHGKAPVNVTKKNQKDVWEILYGKYVKTKLKPAKFQQGDSVRLAKLRGAFKKSYLKGWTDELFIIHTVQETSPRSYKVRDTSGEILKGSFYESELTKVRL